MDPVKAAGALAAIAAGVAGLAYLTRTIWRGLRRLGHVVDEVLGEPARPGHPERPSWGKRLATIEERLQVLEELRPNGGASLKDQVTRIERAIR